MKWMQLSLQNSQISSKASMHEIRSFFDEFRLFISTAIILCVKITFMQLFTDMQHALRYIYYQGFCVTEEKKLEPFHLNSV